MHGHFLYLSNGNFLSQKEQFILVGVETAGGVGEGVDFDASSSAEKLDIGAYWFTGYDTDFFIFFSYRGEDNEWR